MSKGRKNTGLDNLKDLDIINISDDASLQESVQQNVENKSDSKSNLREKKFNKKLQLRLPEDLHGIIIRAINENKATGSLNTFVVESVRRRLVEEGLL